MKRRDIIMQKVLKIPQYINHASSTKQFPKQPKNADAVATIPNGKDLVKVSPTIEDFHDITIDPPSEVSNSVLDTSSINVTSLENHEHEENSSPVPPMSPETLKLFDILYNDDDLNGNKDNTYDAPNAPMSPSTGLQGSCAIDSSCRDLPVPDEPKSMTKIHTEPCLEDTDLPEPDAPTSSPSIIAEPCSVDNLYNDLPMDPTSVDSCNADFPDAPMSPSTGLQGSRDIDSRCRDLPVPDEPKSMTRIHMEPCLEDTDLPEPDAPTSSPSIIAEPCSVDNLYNDLPMDPTSVDSCNADFPDAPMSPSTGLQGSRDIDSRCRDLPVPDEPKSMTRIHMEPCLENTDLPEPDAPTSSPSNLAKPCSVDSLFKELQMDPLSVDSYCTYLPTPDAPLYSPLTPACQNTSCFSRPQARKSPEERLRSVNSHYEDASTPDIPLCSPITPLHRNATSMNQNILENVTDDNDFSSDDHDRDPDYTPGIDRSKESSSSESNILDTILPSTSSSSLPNASEGNITDQGKPKRGRKRKFKEYTLAERKHRRYNNLPYMGKSHEVQPKSYKEFNCSCSKKCFLLVDSEKRKTEFLKFYSLTSYEAQLFYIISNVRETPTKRSYKCNNSKTGINKSRSFSRSYTLCGVSVCKDMFTKTLQISNQKLTISLRKNRSSVDSTKDLRGTLRGGWNKTPQEDVDFISNFINKIPKYQSHYRRENNGEKQYLQPGMTHTKLYNLYLEEFKNAYGESKKCVGFNVFRKIFLTKFNLKCKALKKDTCNICDRLAVQIKCCTSAETKTSLLQEKENHLKTAETLRTIMRNDMDKAKSDKMYECLTYDLEKTLPLPRIPTNLAFYKRQLWFYNCGVHAGSTNTGYCFVWVEGEAGRGAQEVGSCLVYYIKNILNKEVQHLVLWSDSRGGQNRNIKITLLLKAILESHPTLQTITLKYLQPGHTFLPNDTDFSKIETSLKLHPRLYTADDYINVIKKCRIKNPLIVKKMETQNFLGTQKLEKNIVNRKVSVDKNKINWLKIKEILLKKEKLYSLFIKTREGSEEINIEKKIKGKVLPINESLLCPLYPHGKEIAQAKMDDLRSLYPFIPRDCLPFYKNLKGSPNVLDDIDGLGTTPDFDIENSEEE